MPTLRTWLRLQNSLQMAAIISADERAPGSIWPIDRSPRNEARPRMAFIGIVASAAAAASRRSAAEDRRRRRASSACTGASTSSIVFWPTSDLPRALTASIAAAKARATIGHGRLEAGSSLPSVMNSVP